MFTVYRGKTKDAQYPVTTSTALGKGTLVEFTSGKIAAADADEAADNIAGVLVKAITSADADYASDRLVSVRIPVDKHVVWEADASGFSATDIGGEFGISDSGTVDQTETTAKAFKVTEVISATKVRGYLKVNGSY